MTVTVKKLGGSVAVVIPKAIAQEIELTAGTSLDVTVTPKGILFKKRGRRPRRPMSSLVAAMDPVAYRRHRRELPDGPPVGSEVW
jgi:antitoxin component of MazEF toxin-antitoxin module